MSNNTQEYIDRVCEYRQLPKVSKGWNCKVDGKKGTIEGGNSSANFNVQFPHYEGVRNCHPEWKMKIYNDSGELIHDSCDT